MESKTLADTRNDPQEEAGEKIVQKARRKQGRECRRRGETARAIGLVRRRTARSTSGAQDGRCSPGRSPGTSAGMIRCHYVYKGNGSGGIDDSGHPRFAVRQAKSGSYLPGCPFRHMIV